MKSPAEIFELRRKTDAEIIQRNKDTEKMQAEWVEKYAPQQAKKELEYVEIKLEEWATERFKERKNELIYFMTDVNYKILGPMVLDALILNGYKAYGFEYPHDYWKIGEITKGFLIRIDLASI